MHVLFVCTGNICRSPTAERLALAYAATREIPRLTASSAGTRAVIGHPIHDEATRVLESLVGRQSHFAARQLSSKIAANADLLLAMTRSQRDRILELAPQKLNTTFTLAEAAALATRWAPRTIADLPALRPQLIADEKLDISDPIGGNAEVFEAVGRQIAQLLPPVLELLRRTMVGADE